MHGWFDDVGKVFHHSVVTLSPTDSTDFLTIAEARAQADKQLMLRAAQGFRYEFTTNPMKKSPPWYERFELTPPAGRRLLP
jgi:hypothetical protein